MELFIIGDCRSGKTITSHAHLAAYGAFEDMFDAMAVLSALVLRWRRRNVDLESAALLEATVDTFEEHLEVAGQLEIQKEAIGAKTSLDILNHGRKLLRPEFRD